MKRWELGMIDLIIAAELLALVACLLTPVVREAGMHRQAARLANEIKLVGEAARTERERSGEWPEDETPGRMPASLKPHLPPRFTFNRGPYRLDWDHWTLSEGADPLSRTSEFLAVSVIARDPRLAGMASEVLGAEQIHFTLGSRSTFVLSEPGTPTP